MLNRIRTWLIFKLIRDQPVIANVEVKLKSGCHEFKKKTLLIKNAKPI